MLGAGVSAKVLAAMGSIRLAGITLPGKFSPVTGSLMADVKIPFRSARVGTRVIRVTPLVIRVPS